MTGELIAKRYRLLEQVGGGGMALVYKAYDDILNRHVAIKVLRQQFVNDDEFVRRFRREAQAAAALSHPNVVNIYDVGEEKDTHYIVMEYIEGQNLNEKIQQSAPLQVETAIHIASQICDALEHAHQNRIIHRDIKPHNILIGKNGRVKVTDFGIARAAASASITTTGSVIGSVLYFSPEHAKGVPTDEKSDIYSLGIVLYQMLTNQLPFTGESPISVALKHLQDDFHAPRMLNPLIPQSVENIILKSLRKSPAQRYQSAREMLQALEGCLNPDKLHEPKITFTAEVPADPDDLEMTRPMPAIKANASVAGAKSPEDTLPFAVSGKTGQSADQQPVMPPLSRSRKEGSGTPAAGKPNDGMSGGKQWPAWVKPALITSAVLLPLIILISLVVYVRSLFVTPEVNVPDLAAQPVAAATETLRGLGLVPEIIYEPNETIAKDTVIRQDKANMNVKLESVIRLYVSNGLEVFKMVKVTGGTLADAMLAIQRLGVSADQIQIENTFSAEAAETVVGQEPDADTELNPKTVVVKLKVSQGKETSPMPNLLGLSENEAKALLLKSGLKLAATDAVEYSESYLYGKDQVWKQFPYEPGDPVAPGAEIKLFVSTGFPKDSKETTYNIQVSPAVDGQSSSVQVTYTDARGMEQEWGTRTIAKSSTFPVRLVLSPAQNGVITVRREGMVVTVVTVTYDLQATVESFETAAGGGEAPAEEPGLLPEPEEVSGGLD